MASRPISGPQSGDRDLLEAPPGGRSTDAQLTERMGAELARGFAALAGLGPAVTVFGSARTPPGDPEYDLVRRVSRRLGEEGWTIVTGGGPGAMAAANEGAREAGTRSVGLTIDIVEEAGLNDFLDLAVHFHYFFARKIMFVRYASAFVVFPGGLGTLDELFELLTLTQTRKVDALPVVLVGRDFWGGLLAWMRERLLGERKISAHDLETSVLADGPDEVAAAVARAARP
jgi:uncharacterized protein (TIGR00730 family)